MKIISKFKDGYDSFANNPNISDTSWNRVWRRDKTSDINPFAYPSTSNVKFRKVNCFDRDIFYGLTIFFCGKEIPMILHESDYDVVNHKRNYCGYFSFEDLEKSALFKCYRPDEITGIKKFFDVRNRDWVIRGDDGRSLKRMSPKDFCLYFRTPIIVVGGLPYYMADSFKYIGPKADPGQWREKDSYVNLNPCLEDLDFFKYMNRWDAFQELERFICNDMVVPNLKEIKISDVLKAETHGFDKHSFRKEKANAR